jgi:hypothetical protein
MEESRKSKIYLELLCLFKKKEQIKDKIWEQLFSSDKINFLFDEGIGRIPFHGGITFYDNSFEDRVQIGCDYNHYFDEGTIQNENVIRIEVEETIDYIVDNLCAEIGSLQDIK